VIGVIGSTDQVRQLVVGISSGVLLDTFLVRTLLVPAFVVAEATLSYVGLGFPDPMAS